MNTYGDEDYIYYLSNILLQEEQKKMRDYVYIGEELVHLADKEAFIRATIKYMNEVIANDK